MFVLILYCAIYKHFCSLYYIFAMIFLLFFAKNLVIKLCGTIICIITMDNLISVSSMFTSNMFKV